MRRLLVNSVLALCLATFGSAALALDGDGVPDPEDDCLSQPNPDQTDTNADGFGNACDADWTNDGTVGAPDYLLLMAHYGHVRQDPTDDEISLDGSGVVGAPAYLLLSIQYGGPPGPSGYGPDLDGDGWVEAGFDDCSAVANSNQVDSDGDGFGNACDADWVTDGIVDSTDYDLMAAHWGHAALDSTDILLSTDGAGTVGATSYFLVSEQFGGGPGPSGLGGDADADGYASTRDNCPDAYNPDQADGNGDGVGDLCDDEFDLVQTEPGDVTNRFARPVTDTDGDVHLLYTISPDEAQSRHASVRWLRQEAGVWREDTVWVNGSDYDQVLRISADFKSTGELCVFWKVYPGSRNYYGCIDTQGALQIESTIPYFGNDWGGSAYLKHDASDLPHVAAYRHGLYDDGTSKRNHYIRHTWFDGTSWTQPQNLPARPGDRDPESSQVNVLRDDATGVLYFVYFYYDGADPSSIVMGCEDRGDIAVATWDPVNGFGPLHTAIAGVFPGLTGAGVTEIDARLDAAGSVQVAYETAQPYQCQPGWPDEYGPVGATYLASGPVLGPWDMTLLDDDAWAVSEVVIDAVGDVHVAHQSPGDAHVKLYTISGGAVSEQVLDVDTLDAGSIEDLAAAPAGPDRETLLFLTADIDSQGTRGFLVR